MKIFANAFVICCLVASSLCNPVENIADEYVECEIQPESVALDFIQKETEEEGRGGRVVYGNLASTGQFPYYGYSVLTRSTVTALCGSSLIKADWVVTAAHCMRDVRSGQIYFGSTDNKVVRVSSSIRGYVIHPSYNPSTVANDIALVQLYSSVPLSASVQVIRLPSLSQVGRSFDGVRLAVSGFGKTASGALPRYLQYTHVNGLSDYICKQAHWVYSSSMICARSAYTSGSGICSEF